MLQPSLLLSPSASKAQKSKELGKGAWKMCVHSASQSHVCFNNLGKAADLVQIPKGSE